MVVNFRAVSLVLPAFDWLTVQPTACHAFGSDSLMSWWFDFQSCCHLVWWVVDFSSFDRENSLVALCVIVSMSRRRRHYYCYCHRRHSNFLPFAYYSYCWIHSIAGYSIVDFLHMHSPMNDATAIYLIAVRQTHLVHY